MSDEFDKYRKAITDGLKESRKLVEQKRAIEIQLRKIAQLVTANIAMLPDKDESQKFREALEDAQGPTGLRSAVLRILKTDNYLSPSNVLLELSRSGYDMSNHVNPLASVHTTLKRLVRDEEVETHKFTGGIHYRRKTKTVTAKDKV